MICTMEMLLPRAWIVAALLAGAASHAQPAHAQSKGFGWLAKAEKWAMKEEYRGWILHGAIASLVTYSADRIADKPAYGAALATGFYIGKELREAYYWNAPRRDRIMDMVTPVVGAVAAAYLLRHKRNEKPAPEKPPPPPESAAPPADTSSYALDLPYHFPSESVSCELSESCSSWPPDRCSSLLGPTLRAWSGRGFPTSC